MRAFFTLCRLCPVLFVFIFASPALAAYNDVYYSDPALITIERDGVIVGSLPCQRIPLSYPELDGRAEAYADRSSNGDIWVAVNSSEVNPIKRLFRSANGGVTWTSRTISAVPTDYAMVAFTVLNNDTMLLARFRSVWYPTEVFRSTDMGQTWQLTATLRPDPYEWISEGAMSLTQLSDGRVVLPISRWDLADTLGMMTHWIFVSSNGGQTFPAAYFTFPSSGEAHIIELQSGNLLGAFRYQRQPLEGETDADIIALGGQPAATPRERVFKNVFLGDSADGGLTWQNLRPVRDAQGQTLVCWGEAHGQLVQVPDGRVVLVHDHRYQCGDETNRSEGENRARISSDNGLTWYREVYHVSYGSGYPSSVVLEDGTIVTVTGNTPYNLTSGPWTAQVIRWKLPALGGAGAGASSHTQPLTFAPTLVQANEASPPVEASSTAQRTETARIVPGDVAAWDNYGRSVAVSSTSPWRLLVGSQGDSFSSAAWGSGSAYMFRYDGVTWVQEAKLWAADVDADEWFGRAVAISGDGSLAVIGKSLDDIALKQNYAGSAHVFRRSGTQWAQEAKLIANDRQPGDYFGSAVAIGGDTYQWVIAGCPYDSAPERVSGSAYVYRYNGSNWVQYARLTPADGAWDDFFGHAVAAAGDTIVVGSPHDDDKGLDSGSAYVFGFNGSSWSRQAKLLPADGVAADRFGYSVSAYRDGSVIRAVVGTYQDHGVSHRAGSAYVFRFNGSNWSQEAKLTASDGSAGDDFGHSVGICDSTVLIGASSNTQNGAYAGTAYVFRFNGTSWMESLKLLASDGAAYDRFGAAVALGRDVAVVGAYSDGDTDAGSAYLFRGLVDTDSDGITDSYDNCPTVPNPGQQDIGETNAGRQADGIGDACDNCSAYYNPNQADCDSDGVGNVCTIATGQSGDCNLNGVPDECESAGHDCNSNGVLDQCEMAWTFDSTSGSLSPMGWGYPQSYTMISPPEAGSDVTLAFTATGDLDSSSEYINVKINGTSVGTVFAGGAHQCPSTPDTGQIIVPQATYNTAKAGGNVTISMEPTSAVGPALCTYSFISVTVHYEGGEGLDCNHNGILDACEADADGDGVPNTCDLCPGTPPGWAVDENGCTLTPLAPGDFDGDLDVDQQDFGHLQECLTGSDIAQNDLNCQNARLDGDADVDKNDVLVFLACMNGPGVPADPHCAD